ncbi:MAG: PucR family transcriptional regulator, partial [Actinomycetota bacterium]|nr:PucR family transcriptional regulator [Actinomycetota bacterium]
MVDSDPSSELTDLLERLPTGRTVGLAEHDQPSGQLVEGEIVLGIGLADQSAARLLQAAGEARAAAVILRGPSRSALTELAGRAGIELHWLPAAVSWRELHQRLSARLSPPAVRGDDELADLAQTIAVLTGGLVTIEDTSARVLAYSRSSDEVDELRRLSILGRSGPPDYLALLREWGVYDRLAGSEEVVEIAEHPGSGVRRRLAVGVFAGDRQLGTIWVQQGSADFGPHAEQALLGAARLTAVQLVSQGPPAFRRRAGDGLG